MPSWASREVNWPPFGLRVDLVPEVGERKGDLGHLAHEAVEVAIEDGQLGDRQHEAQVVRALLQFGGGRESGVEVDRLAVEIEIGIGKLALDRGEEIHKVRIALQVEIGAAWRLGRNRLQIGFEGLRHAVLRRPPFRPRAADRKDWIP